MLQTLRPLDLHDARRRVNGHPFAVSAAREYMAEQEIVTFARVTLYLTVQRKGTKWERRLAIPDENLSAPIRDLRRMYREHIDDLLARRNAVVLAFQKPVQFPGIIRQIVRLATGAQRRALDAERTRDTLREYVTRVLDAFAEGERQLALLALTENAPDDDALQRIREDMQNRYCLLLAEIEVIATKQ